MSVKCVIFSEQYRIMVKVRCEATLHFVSMGMEMFCFEVECFCSLSKAMKLI